MEVFENVWSLSSVSLLGFWRCAFFCYSLKTPLQPLPFWSAISRRILPDLTSSLPTLHWSYAQHWAHLYLWLENVSPRPKITFHIEILSFSVQMWVDFTRLDLGHFLFTFSLSHIWTSIHSVYSKYGTSKHCESLGTISGSSPAEWQTNAES